MPESSRDTPLFDAKRHPIQVVSRRAGLSTDVLRAWEKRYGLIEPERTATGRRRYSDADIERLRLTKEAMAAGRRVGQLAGLTVEELAALVAEDRAQQRTASPQEPEESGAQPDEYVVECLDAVRALDGEWLRSAFSRAVITLSPNTFMTAVATPLMHRIGTLWAQGRLTPGHEHLASATIRATLAEVAAVLQPSNGASRLVVATPTGQHHDIGAGLAAATAQLEGWFVTHLGADLPATDIAAAAEQTAARAVALSITHPADDPNLVSQLQVLRQTLPGEIEVLVGGQAADSYRTVLTAIGARRLAGLPELRTTLRQLSGTHTGA